MLSEQTNRRSSTMRVQGSKASETLLNLFGTYGQSILGAGPGGSSSKSIQNNLTIATRPH